MDESCGNNLGVKRAAEAESEYQHEDKGAKIQKPLHKFRDSFLRPSMNFNDYKGLLRPFPILFILLNISIGLEYYTKYGLLKKPGRIFSEIFEIPVILIVLSLNLFCLLSFGLEILLLKGVLNTGSGLAFIISSLTLQILTPFLLVYLTDVISVISVVGFLYITVFLKLVSYHVENYSYRRRIITSMKSEVNNFSLNELKRKGIQNEDLDKVQYPDNLNIKNFYRFLFSPSLCYELDFPRRPNIRKKFLFLRLLELLFLGLVYVSIGQQSGIPLLIDYQKFSQGMEYSDCVLISIKYFIHHISSIFVIHCLIFHSILNISGEITRFGDRYFYEDWWNSGNVREFWKTWNLPVHNWAKRYLYKPVLNRGFSKFQALTTVFAVSGILHEYLYGITIKSFKFRTILVFLGQAPLVHYSSNQKTSRTGSIVVWVILYVFGIIDTAFYVSTTYL